jgi:hypothetical protein
MRWEPTVTRSANTEWREKAFHNRVFDSLDALEDHLEHALRDLENDPARVYSNTAWSWIVNAL